MRRSFVHQSSLHELSLAQQELIKTTLLAGLFVMSRFSIFYKFKGIMEIWAVMR